MSIDIQNKMKDENIQIITIDFGCKMYSIASTTNKEEENAYHGGYLAQQEAYKLHCGCNYLDSHLCHLDRHI